MDEAGQIQALINTHGRALVLFARQFVVTHADAEDAVQDAFTRYWPRRKQADDPVAFLYACVRTAALDLARSARRARQRDLHASHDEAFTFDHAAETAELQRMIAQQLDALPADQREVLIMKIWGELTFEQIAAALAISPNTAASRYRYALEKLAAAWPTEVPDERT